MLAHKIQFDAGKCSRLRALRFCAASIVPYPRPCPPLKPVIQRHGFRPISCCTMAQINRSRKWRRPNRRNSANIRPIARFTMTRPQACGAGRDYRAFWTTGKQLEILLGVLHDFAQNSARVHLRTWNWHKCTNHAYTASPWSGAATGAAPWSGLSSAVAGAFFSSLRSRFSSFFFFFAKSF